MVWGFQLQETRLRPRLTHQQLQQVPVKTKNIPVNCLTAFLDFCPTRKIKNSSEVGNCLFYKIKWRQDYVFIFYISCACVRLIKSVNELVVRGFCAQHRGSGWILGDGRNSMP